MKKTAVMICFTMILTAGLLRADDTSFRCGSDLITMGYTMYQVKNSCGAADSEQVIGSSDLSKVRVADKEKADTALNITEWIYNRDGGIYILTFEGDRLVRKEYRNTD
jgi:hypothetical protein